MLASSRGHAGGVLRFCRSVSSRRLAPPIVRLIHRYSPRRRATGPRNAAQGTVLPAPLGHGATSPSEPPAPSLASSRTFLREVYLKDFALVSEQRLQLEPGLNVITGESGAGKSVLVEALGQILGSPAPDEAVRQPAEMAVIEGVVALAPADRPLLMRLLGELGLPPRAMPPAGDLLLRRELLKADDGVRSRCSLNGVPTSVRVLREVGRLLVDVNGQHAALALRDSGRQLALVDQVAGAGALAEALAGTLRALGEVRAQLATIAELGGEQEMEALQRLVDEVHDAGVEPGEDQALRRELRQLESRRSAAEQCRLVAVGLGGGGGEGGGVQDAIRHVELQLKAVLRQEEQLAAAARSDHDREGHGDAEGQDAAAEAEAESERAAGMLQRALELMAQARDALGDAEDEVVEYARQYRFSQAQYDEVYGRLQRLERLMKEYDVSSAEELVQLAEEKAAALDSYFQLEGQQAELEARERQLTQQVQQDAVALSLLRREAAGKLRAAVESVLGDLAMGESRFDVRIGWTPVGEGSSSGGRRGKGEASSRVASIHIGEEEAQQCWEQGGQAFAIRPSGLDSVEFLFAAGPSEPLRPLSAVASGGESARIMLALKAAPALMSGGDQPRPSLSSASEASSSSSSSSRPIMILDEIDSGVGSRLGQPIGRILRSMVRQQGQQAQQRQQAGEEGEAPTSQILCVSHLPQVAAHAHHHICVRKSVEDDRTVTCFESLGDEEARLQEVSAMLGLPLSVARELMAAAEA